MFLGLKAYGRLVTTVQANWQILASVMAPPMAV
jgi:hypothetical protein